MTGTSDRLSSLTTRTGRRLLLIWMITLGVSIAVFVLCLIVQVIFVDILRPGLALRLMALAATAPLFCTGGLVAAAVMRRAKLGGFMLAASATLVASMTWWMIIIWRSSGDGNDDPAWRVPMSLAIVGFSLAVIGYLVTSPDRRPALARLRTVVVISLAVLCYVLMAWMWSRWWESRMLGLMILLGIGGVGTTLGTAALLLTGRYLAARSRRVVESLPQRVTLELHCPRCELEQQMSTGLSQCRRCGLALLIEVEEPRCECGYLLYQLAGDTCPECGRPCFEQGRAGS